jgi:hypothetical protein
MGVTGLGYQGGVPLLTLQVLPGSLQQPTVLTVLLSCLRVPNLFLPSVVRVAGSPFPSLYLYRYT